MARHRRTYGTRAVVTGAGSGIGRALALELVRRGSRVVCADINLDAATETVRLVQQANGEGLAVQCDVSSAESVQSLADASVEWFGNPTLLINNAGIGTRGGRVGESPLSTWERAMAVNLWGVIYGCETFVPLLRKDGRGGVINIASAAGFAAAPGMGSYSVGKAGVVSLSETLAAEFSGTELSVSVVCPTFVATNIFSGELMDNNSARVALARAEKNGSTPEAIALSALDGFERGQLYVLPQKDARFVWRLKRALPKAYPHIARRVVGRLAAKQTP